MNFQIELTNICNLKCVECPHRFMKREQDTMSDEVFFEILNYIDKMKPQTIILHKDGEPLIHPKLFDYMKKIDEFHTTKFDIYTNGLLLKPKFIYGLSELKSIVSILLSYHFYSYKGNRVDYSGVDERLLTIFEYCPKNVRFILATHVTDLASKDELDLWKAEWDDVMQEYEALEAVHVNPHINPWTGLIQQKNAITFPACPYADGQHLFFGVTGNVIACCMDLEEEIQFGNVLKEPFDVIMERREQFYKELNEKKNMRELCLRCLA